MRTALYRHYDCNDRLLYVGISLSTASRISEHMRGSAWAPGIATIKLEYFPSREQAIDAERLAIESEHPIWNRQHNKGRARRMIQAKRPGDIYPTEIGEVICFSGSYSVGGGQITEDATGLPMHLSQAKIKQGSIDAYGRITYSDTLSCL